MSAPQRHHGAGARVNLASVAAFDGQVGRPSCSGSKGGIVGVTLFPKRLGASEEVASRIVEAVTNSYLDAGTIRVDGGIRMQPE